MPDELQPTSEVASQPARSSAGPLFAGAFLGLLGHALFAYALVIYCNEELAPGLTSLALLATFGPMCVAALLTGARADHTSKLAILVRAHVYAGAVLLCFCAALAAGFERGVVTVATISACVLYGGTSGGVAGTRLALLPSVVGLAGIQRAMVILSALTVLSLALAPLTAGYLRASHPWPWLFGSAGALLIAAALLTSHVHEPRVSPPQAPVNGAKGFIEGLHYVRGNVVFAQLLSISVCMWIGVLGPFQSLLPEHIRTVLLLGEEARGALMALFAVGLLFGNTVLATALRHVARRGVMFLGLAGAGGLTFASIAVAPSVGATVVALFATGASLGALNALLPACLQLAIVDQYRGRAMSVYAVLMIACPALGAAGFALIADLVGVTLAIPLAGAASACAATLMFVRMGTLRRLYANA